jgi:hypothetical protein
MDHLRSHGGRFGRALCDGRYFLLRKYSEVEHVLVVDTVIDKHVDATNISLTRTLEL